MNNVSLDTTGFSEQLGIYDFFNVLVYGAIFVCGICVINTDINNYLWCDLTFPKGLGIALMIYIVGMALQELGSAVDRKRTNIYIGMNRSILKGKLSDKYTEETSNYVFENPIILQRYRDLAKEVLKEYVKKENGNDIDYENDFVNGFMFSVSQYYVAIHGKDNKTEKLRALFSMSKTLMSCFFSLAVITLISVFVDIIKTIICSIYGWEYFIGKIILFSIFIGLGYIFHFRSKRTMKNFLLVLMGTYDAILRYEKNNNISSCKAEKQYDV